MKKRIVLLGTLIAVFGLFVIGGSKAEAATNDKQIVTLQNGEQYTMKKYVYADDFISGNIEFFINTSAYQEENFLVEMKSEFDLPNQSNKTFMMNQFSFSQWFMFFGQPTWYALTLTNYSAGTVTYEINCRIDNY